MAITSCSLWDMFFSQSGAAKKVLKEMLSEQSVPKGTRETAEWQTWERPPVRATSRSRGYQPQKIIGNSCGYSYGALRRDILKVRAPKLLFCCMVRCLDISFELEHSPHKHRRDWSISVYKDSAPRAWRLQGGIPTPYQGSVLPCLSLCMSVPVQPVQTST